MFWRWYDFRKESQRGVISLRRSSSLTGKPNRHLEEVQGCGKSRTPKARGELSWRTKGVPPEKRAACAPTGASPAAPGGCVNTHAGPQLQAAHFVGRSGVGPGTWISKKLQGNSDAAGVRHRLWKAPALPTVHLEWSQDRDKCSGVPRYWHRVPRRKNAVTTRTSRKTFTTE